MFSQTSITVTGESIVRKFKTFQNEMLKQVSIQSIPVYKEQF